jgi:hypothetical protein
MSARSNRIAKLEAEASRQSAVGPQVHVVRLYADEAEDDAWRAEHGDARPGDRDLVVFIRQYGESSREGAGR